jgi:hypothetical protein
MGTSLEAVLADELGRRQFDLYGDTVLLTTGNPSLNNERALLERLGIRAELPGADELSQPALATVDSEQPQDGRTFDGVLQVTYDG